MKEKLQGVKGSRGRGSYSGPQQQPERLGASEQQQHGNRPRQGRGQGRGSSQDHGAGYQQQQGPWRQLIQDAGPGRSRQTIPGLSDTRHAEDAPQHRQRKDFPQHSHTPEPSTRARTEEHQPRTSSSDEESLTSVTGALTLREPSAVTSTKGWASRPGYSKVARKHIRVVTNLFRLQCRVDAIYHYDVDIIPMDKVRRTTSGAVERPLPRNLCHRIVMNWYQKNNFVQHSPVYNGAKSLFTFKKLPFEDETQFRVPLQEDRGRTREFALVIKPVQKKKNGTSERDNKIDMTAIMKYVKGETPNIPEEARMVLEAVLAYRPPGSPQMAIGNAFFKVENVSKYDLGGGMEMWSGCSQNIRFTTHGPAIVINTAVAVFFKPGPIIDTVCDILRRDICQNPNLHFKDIEKLSKKLSTLQVRVTHQKNKRKYRIERVSEKNASQQTLDGSPVTVQQYIESQYKIRLQFPYLPCLKMASSKNSNVFIPMEVCEVLPNQRVKGKLDERLAANMIKKTAIPPKQKFRIIEDSARDMSNTCAQRMREYGLGMDLRPVETDARVLPQPAIQYESQKVSVRDNGVWEMRHSQFTSGRIVQKPLLICFANCDKYKLDKYCELMCRVGKDVGLAINPRINKLVDNRMRTRQAFEQAKMQNADLILFVLDKGDIYHPYDEIKYLAEIEYKIVTQCVTKKVVDDRMDARTATNICLKINTKMGGVNHQIQGWPPVLKQHGMIIMGADVIHHLKDGYPSIAALVAGVDESVAQYAHCCRALKNPKEKKSQEIILDLEIMVKNVLMKYYKQNKQSKPSRILFFRDGISEGQFKDGFEKEIPMIRKACKSLQQDYRPTITYVVVQKRHPIRIRPKNENDGVGKCGNVPAGTLVDKDIVDPQLYDFYLCSHEGIQGTSKPTRYTVLLDENCFATESMEAMTYNLCHLVARCNRSISIPAPVKYADLLCTRASDYVNYLFRANRALDPERIEETMSAMDKMNLQMFFV